MTDNHIKTALLSVCPNVERLRYTGEAQTFITFQLVTSLEVDHADDDSGGMEFVYRFDIYSKANYLSLIDQAITALKAVDCYGFSIDPEVFEHDTGYFHVPVEFRTLRTEE